MEVKPELWLELELEQPGHFVLAPRSASCSHRWPAGPRVHVLALHPLGRDLLIHDDDAKGRPRAAPVHYWAARGDVCAAAAANSAGNSLRGQEANCKPQKD